MNPNATTAAVGGGGRVSPNSGGGQPKHRACDECRTRKLACSKEPDGCARCKREGILCHYSPQKPMGRPRKRPHVEVAGEETTGEQEGTVAQFGDPGMPDLSFIDPDPSVEFNLLDLLGPGWSDAAVSGPQSQRPVPAAPDGQWFDFGNVSFDDTYPGGHAAGSSPHYDAPIPEQQQQRDLSSVEQQAILQHHNNHFNPLHLHHPTAAPPSCLAATGPASGALGGGLVGPDAIPELSPPHSTSSGSDSSPKPLPPANPATFPNVVCPCLAKIYLALDSLQNLPIEVGPAMACARNAARTAHLVTECPTCSPPNFIDPNFRPSVQAFQNLMMLGALLPSIANAYNRILPMIDEEARRATEERRRIPFALHDYGGLWGRLGHESCTLAATITGQPMEPGAWRTTVRALLRVDVYGVNSSGRESMSMSCRAAIRHVGLKDIIEQLEERSRMRHAYLDELYATGQLKDPHHVGHMILPPGEKHNCQRILEMARTSIEHLVII